MMKILQGIDIVDISKLKRIIQKNKTFISDIFTEKEREYCESRKDPYIHFAGRFAAKESFMKALGTGFSGIGIDHLFQEIEVLPAPSGKPELHIKGWAEKLAKKRRIRQCTVSISHASDYAVASVILIGN
ncbi:MAG: holo-[acyl-carrier-protein] synthase [Nitrospira sp.]|nr:holo-[acyl-carrier-protein] synthase [Nitrospira sp.]